MLLERKIEENLRESQKFKKSTIMPAETYITNIVDFMEWNVAT